MSIAKAGTPQLACRSQTHMTGHFVPIAGAGGGTGKGPRLARWGRNVSGVTAAASASSDRNRSAKASPSWTKANAVPAPVPGAFERPSRSTPASLMPPRQAFAGVNGDELRYSEHREAEGVSGLGAPFSHGMHLGRRRTARFIRSDATSSKLSWMRSMLSCGITSVGACRRKSAPQRGRGQSSSAENGRMTVGVRITLDIEVMA
jgi:hypothetical protein